ncbi:MAG: hypothetical protein KDD60_09965, partial [Bdellovibrionales bacterium]|nr:hypothetical protein [Bdellovibrionales bacterium]
CPAGDATQCTQNFNRIYDGNTCSCTNQCRNMDCPTNYAVQNANGTCGCRCTVLAIECVRGGGTFDSLNCQCLRNGNVQCPVDSVPIGGKCCPNECPNGTMEIDPTTNECICND